MDSDVLSPQSTTLLHPNALEQMGNSLPFFFFFFFFFVTSQDGPQGATGGFIRIQSELPGRGLTIQCEHSNCGLWFYIADDLPVQYQLELTNNFSKIEQGMHSFQGAGT